MANEQRTPIVDTLPVLVERAVATAIRKQGRAWPCRVTQVSGQIVTVNFLVQNSGWTIPTVQMPIATSVYDWLPVQVGDLGVTMPADVYIGGISGLGVGGTANTAQRANLATLVFVPVSNSAWTVQAPANVNQRVVQGPQGVVLQDTGGKCVFDLTEDGITITVGGKTWRWTSDGLYVDGYIQATGDMTTLINNVNLSAHQHSGVQPGSGDTGAPVPNT
jgi:GpV Apex motif